MKPLVAGAAWLIGAALSSAAIFVVLGLFSRIDPQMWMVFTLALVTGLVMRSWPNVRSQVQWSLTVFYMAAYVATVGSAWVLGMDKTSLSPTLRSLAQHAQVVAAVMAVGLGLLLAVLAVAYRKKSPWASVGLAAVIICSSLVAFFSGTRGAPGGSAAWLASFLHIGPAAADAIVHFARKTVHFVFFGSFAWFGLRAAQAAGASRGLAISSAFAFALSHACIDEWRQVSAPGRTGSAWDVLLDLSGMVVFVFLATRRPNKVRPSAA